MNLVLLGYRGCGKTSVGRLVAAATGREFYDVDAVVVERFGGRSIRQIWDDEGEAAFRAVEARVTAELVNGPGRVIGLGGGTLMFPEARRAVEGADAWRIYLYAPAATLAARIAADPASAETRPNLTALGGGVAEVEAVLAERDPGVPRRGGRGGGGVGDDGGGGGGGGDERVRLTLPSSCVSRSSFFVLVLVFVLESYCLAAAQVECECECRRLSRGKACVSSTRTRTTTVKNLQSKIQNPKSSIKNFFTSHRPEHTVARVA